MLFKKRRAPRSTEGKVIYAVGDVHGRADLLTHAIEQIHDDMDTSGSADRAQVIFLGDYIDRGPASSQVLSMLSALQAKSWAYRFLKGNHEAALLEFLQDASSGPAWVVHGGAETLAAFGVTVPRGDERHSHSAWERAREELAGAIPATQMRFLKSLQIYAVIGDYVFVHAGLRPGVPLARQSERDMISIRESFLRGRKPFEHTVVHGHIAADEPYHDERRIGIDTGAYISGVLTVARLEDSYVHFIQARVGATTRNR